MIKYASWAHSSVVEQFPLKEKVDGSNPSGLTQKDFSGKYVAGWGLPHTEWSVE